MPPRKPMHRPGHRTGARLLLCGVVNVAAVLLCALPSAAQDAGDGGIAVGARPEPVVLETLDGEPVDLGQIVGDRPVLLEFWATWCTVCRALEPAMRAAHDAYGDRVEFVVIAAAIAQTQERVKQHIARHPVPGRVVWDTRGRATRAYDAPGTGFIVVLDRDGAVAYTGTGAGQDLVTALAAVVDP